MKEFMFDLQRFQYIHNYTSNTVVNGTSNADTICNYYWASEVTINGAGGNDYIDNWSDSSRSSINGGDGDDTVSNSASKVTINGGYGDDSIKNEASKVTIDGGGGNDKISSSGSNVTINGGAGNDRISLLGTGGLIPYLSGDGNDTVWGFNESDTLTIVGGSYTTTKSGNDVFVQVGDGSILLVGAKGKELNINKTDNRKPITLTENNDKLYNSISEVTINGDDGNDSLYNYKGGSLSAINGGDGADTVYNWASSVTINGGAGNDSIKNAASKVTFKYAVGDGNDTITGFNETSTLSVSDSSYTTMKYDKDIIVSVGDGMISLVGAASLSAVNIIVEETNSWTLSGTTAKYGTADKTLVTVKGVKSIDGLSVSEKVVTVKKSSLGTSKVTISNGYTLKLADDVPKPTTKKAAFSLSGSTATYKSSYKTAGYTLASDGKSISYTKATTAKSLATIKGAASKSGLSISGNKITLKKSALNKKVTVSGGYEFNFASDYKSAMISGSSNADSITANGSKLSINAGKGNDTIKALGANISVYGGAGADIFIYKAGKNGVITDYNTEDTISIAGGTAKVTTSGSDLIFTADNGKITVKGGKDKTVTYIDAGGKKTYKSSNDSKIITLTDDYDKETYTMGDKLRTVDASAVELDIKITGNKYINKIVGGVGNDTLIGGKSNDTLTGGNGSDIFVYNNGDGNDLITDYAEEDKISISGDKVSNIKSKGSDIIFTVGSGTITVVGGKDKLITYVDSKGEHIYPQIFTVKGKTITLTDEYTKKDFDVADYGDYKNINASSVEHGLNIVGNDSSNSITGTSDEDIIDGGANNDTIRGGNGNDSLIGGKGKDYLYGGEGNDTLWGGKGDDYLYGGEGADLFIYEPGDGVDRIYNYDANFDTIKLLSGTVKNSEAVGNDIVFTIGIGKIVLDEAAGKYAEIIDGSGEVKKYIPKNRS